MSELRPCPFCGHNDIKISNDYHPKCRNCGAVQDCVIGIDAEKAWNTRASDKRIEQLEKEKQQLVEFASSLQLCVSNEVRLEELLEQLKDK